ncbi:MAG: glycosyltransferase family 2 protein, partial [Flavobacterium sp.]
MPVFNSERYLKQAIESILNQTFKNFEFIIINDGSSDSSDKIINSFNDTRIIYVNNETNRGIVAALNEGLSLSKGKYIARMDADDVANPDRLTLQHQFLINNPAYKLCGTNAVAINNEGENTGKIKRPNNSSKIKALQLFR